MKAKNPSRNQQVSLIKPSSSYISLSKSVLGNKKLDKTLTSSTSFTISQQDRFKNRNNLIYETTDITGDMFKKKFKDPSPTFGNWDKFINRSIHQDIRKTKQVSGQKIIENSLTVRTISPILVKEDTQKLRKRVNTSNYLKSTANGSISNLLNATPFEKKPTKQSRILNSSGIFTPDLNAPKHKKHMVDVNDVKKNSSYAGVTIEVQNKDFNPEKRPLYNYSKNKKISSLKSLIFEPISKENNEKNDKKNSVNYCIDIIDNTKNKRNNNVISNKNPALLSQRISQTRNLLK